MAFVYRFRKDQKTVYIGKVERHEPQNFVNRMYVHSRKSAFYYDCNYVEYIDGLSSWEADILETFFINSDREHLVNKAKLCKIPIRFRVVYEPVWTRLFLPKKGSGSDGALRRIDYADVLREVQTHHIAWDQDTFIWHIWHRADFDLPATRVEHWEEDGDVYGVLLSDPVLVFDNEGEMSIALWEDDRDTGFRGWVDPHNGTVISGVTHWRLLPDPPGGKP